MEQQPPSDSASAGELQFDRAELGDGQAEDPGHLQCNACDRPIAGAYYEVNGEVVCEACQAQAVALRTGGSALGRVLRATIFGLLAGAVGAAIYYAILALTGYEVGLVAIVVGFLVGFAVSFGSRQRGGWFYQLLAVGITYCAIVSTYVPMIVGQLRQVPVDEEMVAAPDSAEAPTGVAEASGEPVGLFAEEPSPQPSSEPAPVAETAPSDGATTAETMPEPASEDIEMVEMPDAFLWIIAVPMAFVAPFFAGFENILGILIIGFGLWQAWQLNRKRPFEVSGPFQVAGSRAAP